MTTTKVDPLEGLTTDEVDQILNFWTRREFDDGHTIIDQGTPGTHMLWFLRGGADVLVDGVRVAELEQNEWAGEMSFVLRGPYSATLVATSRCEVAFLDHAGLKRMTEELPAFGVKFLWGLLQILAGRARKTTKDFADASSELAIARGLVARAKASGFLTS